MKKLILIILALILLASCTRTSQTVNDYTAAPTTPAATTVSEEPPPEMRGVWISFIELNFPDKSKEYFVSRINRKFGDISGKGFNAVFVHVRSHADAYYRSEIFPFSRIVSGRQGRDPGFDPLQIMLYFADRHGLQFHAWLNPFRVLSNDDLSLLSDCNPAKKFIEADNGYVRAAAGGYYFNPAIPAVQELILAGIEEILVNYDVDGIHLDDYFYPTTARNFDAPEFAAYRESTENPKSLGAWRRENVNKLVRGIHKLTQYHNSVFGISPHSSIYFNYNRQFADIVRFSTNPGYIDYIAPQIYFGFEFDHVTPFGQPLAFDKCVAYWNALVTNGINVYIGLGLYRAGEQGEWSENDDIIKRQIEYLRGKENVHGFIIFSYSFFNRNRHSRRETRNFLPIIS